MRNSVGQTTAGALVIEEDAVACEHLVGLPVVNNDPVAVQLGGGCVLRKRCVRARERENTASNREGAEYDVRGKVKEK